MKHLSEEPVPPRSLRPDLPEPAEEAILKALAKEPAARFASAAGLAAAFETGLKGEWTEDLLPAPTVTAVSLADTQQQPPVPVVPVPSDALQPDRLVLGPVTEAPGSYNALAFAPTFVNTPVVVSQEPRPRRRLLLFGLLTLAIAMLIFAGLLVLAASKVGAPVVPAHPVPTSTVGVPTRSAATPGPSTGATPSPTPGNTPTLTPSPTPTHSPTPTPTPTSTPTLTPTPTPTRTPGATPTPTAARARESWASPALVISTQ